jgi:DNA-binding NarL/FixJ family response regulator
VVAETLKAGVRVYLLERAAPMPFRKALRDAARHERYVEDPELQRAVLAHLAVPGPRAGSPERALATLTPREREAYDLLVQGRRTREMAAALSLSQRAVELHLTNIYSKFGVEGRAQLLAFLRTASGSAG